MAVPRLLRLEHGPDALVLVRHGESVGNIADREARERGDERLDLKARDADVELSEVGRRQAAALGRWLADDPGRGPTVVLSSPYERALATARTAVEDLDLDVIVDERLRERDLGLFDGLTGAGIGARYADEAERRAKVGKFYYQPPSGESWADVVLRVRSLLGDLREGMEGERVWIFSHQAVIMSLRYVLDGLDEEEILAVEKEQPIANVSLTTYRQADGGLRLESFADTSVVDAADVDATHEQPASGDAHD